MNGQTGRRPLQSILSREESQLAADVTAEDMIALLKAHEYFCGISDDTLLAIMARDKKALHGRLRFVLPDRIGQVELIKGVDHAAATAAIAAVRAG